MQERSRSVTISQPLPEVPELLMGEIVADACTAIDAAATA